MSLLPLDGVRAAAAAALAPADGEWPDLNVLVDVVDAVHPPALMLVWNDPWLEPQAMGRCLFYARLEVLAIASRVEPGPGVQMLERLTGYALAHLAADSYTWPAATVQAPRVFTINGVRLLGAQLFYRVPVTI